MNDVIGRKTMLHEKTVQDYVKKLHEQKELYEKILGFSHKEQELLCSSNPRIGKVISFLSEKQHLLSSIGIIENDLIPLRESIKKQGVYINSRSSIASLHESIGTLLTELLKIDSENETLLQRQLHMTKPTVDSKRAIRAYQTLGK